MTPEVAAKQIEAIERAAAEAPNPEQRKARQETAEQLRSAYEQLRRAQERAVDDFGFLERAPIEIGNMTPRKAVQQVAAAERAAKEAPTPEQREARNEAAKKLKEAYTMMWRAQEHAVDVTHARAVRIGAIKAPPDLALLYTELAQARLRGTDMRAFLALPIGDLDVGALLREPEKAGVPPDISWAAEQQQESGGAGQAQQGKCEGMLYRSGGRTEQGKEAGKQQQPGGKLGEGEAAHDTSPTADLSKKKVRRHLLECPFLSGILTASHIQCCTVLPSVSGQS